MALRRDMRASIPPREKERLFGLLMLFGRGECNLHDCIFAPGREVDLLTDGGTTATATVLALAKPRRISVCGRPAAAGWENTCDVQAHRIGSAGSVRVAKLVIVCIDAIRAAASWCHFPGLVGYVIAICCVKSPVHYNIGVGGADRFGRC